MLIAWWKFLVWMGNKKVITLLIILNDSEKKCSFLRMGLGLTILPKGYVHTWNLERMHTKD